LQWNECKKGIYPNAYIDGATGSVTDIDEASATSRTTFIGGAAVGLLGALLVEILLAVIDLRTSRKASRDAVTEDAEDTPDPSEPYNPQSRGYP
jgi:hypothetical protein